MLPKNNLLKGLVKAFDKHSIPYRTMDPSHPDTLRELYNKEFETNAYILESQHPSLPKNCWLDCISSLCRRNPVLVISEDELGSVGSSPGRSELLPWLKDPGPEEIIAVLDAAGCLGINHRVMIRNAIPFYNQMLSLHMLQQNGSLSILSIQADEFSSIATEYGAEAYARLQTCFQQILVDLWGASGSFRKNDILCRKASHSNAYYILLEQSRSQQSIPPPGALEKLSDRVVNKIQSHLWNELFKSPKERILPNYLNSIPRFSIGHATAITNPCVSGEEIIDSLADDSMQMARVQMKRIINRQREHIQAMIRTKGILTPHFQGVFDARKLTIDQVKESRDSGSLGPVSHGIYGFESLIRVNEKLVDQVIKSDGPIYVDSKFMRPDILFSIASSVNLALELDQACLQVATQYFKGLPGLLFANILPRNFYYIEKLQSILSSGVNLIFEVSESEAINNFDLILKTKQDLAKKSYGIAIDDFGKGYAGLDRILKMKPDVVKLDRCLIQDIHKEPSKKAFVDGVINAARITKSCVLAEGVEIIEEMECLQKSGIDLIQGFLIHKPQDVKSLSNDLGTPLQELETVA